MKKLIFASALLLLAASSASADEMDWSLKNKTKMDCRLADGMTLKHDKDFVEVKRLICWDGVELVHTASVSCGPEGSVTRFGKKIKVTCMTQRHASK